MPFESLLCSHHAAGHVSINRLKESMIRLVVRMQRKLLNALEDFVVGEKSMKMVNVFGDVGFVSTVKQARWRAQ